MQAIGHIPEIEKIPTGYGPKDVAKLQALSYQYEVRELIDIIEGQLVNRKTTYRNIRLELRKEITEELRKEHRPLLTNSQKQTNRRFVEINEATESGVSDDEDDGVDADILKEEQDTDSREKPECWGE
ncbi:hypothetical protein GMOD_00001168 [Pyrenophora seminiperda CCB06]|uniref:Uncharacterized protein n=1 Tax=Pyrenophora seminiperda CCB06 TaxID=1302712 RepID=A0A3M7LYK4_9PLEO|nr:hypothetical protein GMOD_00001168 [Pyrenophora seminiperda CCB06]